MSEDERELENELDSEVVQYLDILCIFDPYNNCQNEEDGGGANLSHLSDSDKRAHHNALERKRRDHIKDSFNGLKDAIPTLQVTTQDVQETVTSICWK